MDYQEHGFFQVVKEGNIIQVTASGSFNGEAAKRYAKSIEESADSLSDAPFGIAIDLTSVEGATPDAWQIIDKHNEKLAVNPMLIGKSIICKSSLITYFAERVNEDKFKSKVKVFTSHTEAKAWLDSKF